MCAYACFYNLTATFSLPSKTSCMKPCNCDNNNEFFMFSDSYLLRTRIIVKCYITTHNFTHLSVTVTLYGGLIHLSLFEISFPIKIGCLDETDIVRFTGIEQKNVCRDLFVTGELNEVTNTHLTPLLLYLLIQVPFSLNKNRVTIAKYTYPIEW